MNYVVDHIPKSTPHNRRNGWVMKPEYITIHSTGNPQSTAKNERGWLTNPSNTRQASFHIVVDEREAIECIPLNEVAWHAGDGRNGTGNRKTISIEICESGNREKTLQNAIELTAKLLYERGWGVDKLRRHFDWSGKNCPRILNYNNWQGWTKFKNDVQKELNKLKQPKKEVIKVDNKNQTVSNWAKEAWDWAKKNKITDGKRPKDTMTREEMVTMLYRFSKLK
jgi:N-acetylmuramoyl-L-alanine amidase